MEEHEDPVRQRAEARVGTVLKEKWKLDKLLGVGGMAVVYSATHRNGKRVAIKMLHPEMSLDANVRQRFLREGYVANRVGHRGAVAVDDDDTAEDGSAFLVMELLQGETLDARMRRKGGRLPADEVLALADQILDTLTAAHEQGIVHRDLKPENLFITREGVVKMLDFGIARLREMTNTGAGTQMGSLMGTPSFMAPEQARGRWEEVDARSDLWSLGATMFTLLTSRFVHEAETANEALVLAVTARARSVATLLPDLRPEVVELVDKSLEYEKDARFQTAKEMQEALRDVYTSLQGPARVPQVSVPDVAPESNVSIVDSTAAATTGVSSTGPGTAASVVSAAGATAPPAHKPDSSQRPLLFAAIAGGALVIVGAALLLRGGHADAEQTPSTAAPSTVTTVAAPPEPAKPTPQVTPAEGPREGTAKARAVSVDSLPLDKAADDAPKPPPAVSAKPEPKKAEAPAAPAVPAAKPASPAAPPPAWLEAAQTQAPAQVKPAAPPPAPPGNAIKKPAGDPFSKRF